MNSVPERALPPPVQLQFEDNRLLPSLYGEHDRNLARIEAQLGVSMATRGNRLAISGPARAVDIARAALTALYDRLKRGLDVDQHEIDAAIRLARDAEPRQDGPAPAGDLASEDLALRTRKRLVTPRSPAQAAYVRAMQDQDLVFGIGPAGTGKTYLAVAMALTMMLRGRIDRIVLSRPAVEAGERLGFLPGDLREKVDPYLRPLYDALHDMLPGDQVMNRLQSGDIEVAPLAFMRGRTLSNCFIILDEAQNTTPVQMKMFLTRLGENSRMVVTGDLTQVDLPAGTRSGLTDAAETLDGVEGIATIRFTEADVVRHPLVTRMVQAYERRERRPAKQSRGVPPE
ncbi:MAG TPA: PhoH family protein [Alphaproteobacteria bacterium]|nr:PhoH family protein [Alphaproteobacteria bacterium]